MQNKIAREQIGTCSGKSHSAVFCFDMIYFSRPEFRRNKAFESESGGCKAVIYFLHFYYLRIKFIHSPVKSKGLPAA
jgi:hypothetical protein